MFMRWIRSSLGVVSCGPLFWAHSNFGHWRINQILKIFLVYLEGCKIYPTCKALMEEPILSSFILGCVITSGLYVAKNEKDG
jgi:hypothetical protein